MQWGVVMPDLISTAGGRRDAAGPRAVKFFQNRISTVNLPPNPIRTPSAILDNPLPSECTVKCTVRSKFIHAITIIWSNGNCTWLPWANNRHFYHYLMFASWLKSFVKITVKTKAPQAPSVLCRCFFPTVLAVLKSDNSSWAINRPFSLCPCISHIYMYTYRYTEYERLGAVASHTRKIVFKVAHPSTHVQWYMSRRIGYFFTDISKLVPSSKVLRHKLSWHSGKGACIVEWSK